MPSTRQAVWGSLLLALVLVVAACGDGDDGGADPVAPLPTAPADMADQPVVEPACVPDEPLCDDTAVIGDPQPLPDSEGPTGDATRSPSSGFVVGGGLTVAEALTTDATGVLAVQGFIVDAGEQALLCELLAESFPPQCGGASVPVIGYEDLGIGPFIQEQGVIWTDQPVVILGELVDGVLIADPTVAG